ncbi:folate-binding protein [Hwanghaeella grinnelliae]|uniref:Folate-binding protein n=1 Tax=Hwanghaeella grinnelliae TaxID=2500179 RepID=A0A3S2VNH4_9PROT|nr:folate-binding protein YgfZ [Hwanghaeella grinnelliae]RVU34748.1 folate-binding protein [Hwanghaeella grinnelliae]
MTDNVLIPLTDRGVISVGGPDRVDFLQGLVSNDVEQVRDGLAVWAALLTPQGKFRHDFFLVADGDTILIDCEGGDRLMDLGRTLHKYKLRSDVVLGISEGWSVLAALGGAPAVDDGVVFADPRHSEMGWRVLSPKSPEVLADETGCDLRSRADYDAVRIPLGLPDGSRDMLPDKAILLENGFDELSGVDWNKGCFMGQELTARTKYRGLVKKRLLPVRFIPGEGGELPEPGTQVLFDDRDAGEIRSVTDGVGLALLRLEAIEKAAVAGQPMTAGGIAVQVAAPAWLDLSRNASRS